MWTSPAPEIDKFHRKFPKITRALVLAQPETTSSDEDADDGSAEVGTIETSEDARRVLKHARYERAGRGHREEDTSEDDAASASGGDSTPRVAGAVTRRRRRKQRQGARNRRLQTGGLGFAVVVGPAVEDVRESVDPVAVSRPANEPDTVAVKPSPSNARRSHPSGRPGDALDRRNGERISRDAKNRSSASRTRRARRRGAAVSPRGANSRHRAKREGVHRRGELLGRAREPAAPRVGGERGQGQPLLRLEVDARARDVSRASRDVRRAGARRRAPPNHGKARRVAQEALRDPTEVAMKQAAAFLSDGRRRSSRERSGTETSELFVGERTGARAASRTSSSPANREHFVGAAAPDHQSRSAAPGSERAVVRVEDVRAFFPRATISARTTTRRARRARRKRRYAERLRRATRDGVTAASALRAAPRLQTPGSVRRQSCACKRYPCDDCPARTPLDEAERAELRDCLKKQSGKRKRRSRRVAAEPRLRAACVAALDALDRASPQAFMEGDCGFGS